MGDKFSTNKNLIKKIYKDDLIGKQKWTDISPQYIRKNPKIGRNALCPCGSGLKFKKCCMGKTNAK